MSAVIRCPSPLHAPALPGIKVIKQTSVIRQASTRVSRLLRFISIILASSLFSAFEIIGRAARRARYRHQLPALRPELVHLLLDDKVFAAKADRLFAHARIAGRRQV